MYKRIFLLITVVGAFSLGLVFGEEGSPRFQYGFKFGIVRNSFEGLPDSPQNPFASLKVDSKIGFLAGAFYDIALFHGKTDIYFTTAASYKFINFKGAFATEDDPPVLGDFHNYYHVLDVPLGIKVAFNKMNGHPYLGAGVQTDFILADNHSVNAEGVTGDIDTIPGYNTRTNVGFYFNTGFEIPSSAMAYVIDFKYIWWGMDNFTAAESFYKRSKGEIQLTFGIKIH